MLEPVRYFGYVHPIGLLEKMMDGKSLNVQVTQVEKLKQIFPEVVSEGKIDWEKLKLALGEDLTIADERYVLNWAGKADAFRAIQTQTMATLVPTEVFRPPLSRQEQSGHLPLAKGDNAQPEHVFIEGENLEVLKVLQKSYYGKIKMIYIDPPYNTGNDSFIYPDKFAETKEDYLRRIGDKDEAGYLTREGFFRRNSKESGHYHSNWLTMMYPRLFLARNLLRDDGVIFVSIDDNEVHNLRLLMNEIFGEENFVDAVIWQKKVSPSNDATWFSSDHDYLLAYAKNKTVWRPVRLPMNERQMGYYKNPDNDPRGTWNSATYTCNKSRSERPNLYYPIKNPNTGEDIYPRETAVWAYSKELNRKHVEQDLLYWGVDGKARMPRLKKFLDNAGDVVPRSIWSYSDVGHTQEATREYLELFPNGGFNSPKPTRLIKKAVQISTTPNSNDVILDFFAGSGTTAQAVLKLNKEDGGNRKFILVQLPEKTDPESEAHKAGYTTIAEICKERIRRVLQKIQNEKGKSKKAEKTNAGQEELSLHDGSLNQDYADSSDSHDSKHQDNHANHTNPGSDGFACFRLQASNFKIWRTDTIESEEDLQRQMEAFADPVRANALEENMAWEILIKSGYELTTPIERIDVCGSPVYSIAGGELLLALTSITEAAVTGIIERKPTKVICLDKLFANNDQLKTNTVLQMKDAGVEFEVV